MFEMGTGVTSLEEAPKQNTLLFVDFIKYQFTENQTTTTKIRYCYFFCSLVTLAYLFYLTLSQLLEF